MVLEKLWVYKFMLTLNFKNEIESVCVGCICCFVFVIFLTWFHEMLKIHFAVLFSFPLFLILTELSLLSHYFLTHQS